MAVPAVVRPLEDQERAIVGRHLGREVVHIVTVLEDPQAATRLLREIRAPHSPEILTERETEVLKALAQGQSNKEIAHHLVISEKTVKTHVTHILNKLQIPSRTQAALYAIRIGLVWVDASDEATPPWKDS